MESTEYLKKHLGGEGGAGGGSNNSKQQHSGLALASQQQQQQEIEKLRKENIEYKRQVRSESVLDCHSFNLI